MQVLGTQQSPVKIVTANTFHVDFPSDYLQFRYTGVLTGHFDSKKKIFLFDPAGEDTPWAVKFAGVQWFIRQVHIHTPAEHLLDSDAPKPYECHLVHSRAGDPDGKGDKLVIGVFLRGRSSGKKKVEDSCASFDHLDPTHYLPDNRGRWYRYEGSLTSWPYTEDVSWVVMADEARVSPDALNPMIGCANQHKRHELFPLDRRFVLRSFAAQGGLAKRTKGRKAASEA
jgi:carbonic anhydrase